MSLRSVTGLIDGGVINRSSRRICAWLWWSPVATGRLSSLVIWPAVSTTVSAAVFSSTLAMCLVPG